MLPSPYVLELDHCTPDAVTRVGRKSTGLGHMIRAGVRVPPGFAVTTDAYKLVLARTGLEHRMRVRLDRLQVGDVRALTAISEELRTWLEAVEIPREIEDAIRRSYVDLGATCGQTDPPVAVRSSAVLEDLPDASFAGQHDTFLWVRGLDGVLRSLRQCWASLFTARAITYRGQNKFATETAAMGIAVQKMVHARTAGIACTLNPVNGDRSKVVIDASWGLGEAVARGEVTPDQYVVDKVAVEVVKRTVSHKDVEYAVDAVAGGVQRREVPSERRTAPCLSDDECLALASTAEHLEAYFGEPQYLEWAIDADLAPPDRVVMLQSRPETVWSRRPRAPMSGDRPAGVKGVLATLLRPLQRPSRQNDP